MTKKVYGLDNSLPSKNHFILTSSGLSFKHEFRKII